MKKSILFTVFTLLITYSYATIDITKSGAGPNGYNVIKETHDGDNHKLVCKDPGFAGCGWTTEPTIIGGSGTIYFANFLSSLAEDQIALGNNSGTIIHNGEIQIMWAPVLGGHNIIISAL